MSDETRSANSSSVVKKIEELTMSVAVQDAAIKRIETTMERVAVALERIAILEDRHKQYRDTIARAFTEIKEVREEVTDIRKKLPVVLLVSNSAVKIAMVIFTAIVLAVLAYIGFSGVTNGKPPTP